MLQHIKSRKLLLSHPSCHLNFSSILVQLFQSNFTTQSFSETKLSVMYYHKILFMFTFFSYWGQYESFNNLHFISRMSSRKMSCSKDLSSGIQRNDFPILNIDAYPGKKLLFLDSAASSQKPFAVIGAMDEYYKNYHANVHRGAYSIANKATEAFENTRDKIKDFINAKQREEIVFVRGATEGINLLALSWGQRLRAGDEIVLTVMEHHSNIVPWQMLAQRSGAKLKFAQLDKNGAIDLSHFQGLLSERTKMVGVVHASNVLGYLNPIAEIIKLSKQVGSSVLLDVCQSLPHMQLDVQSLDVDFIVASSHKMCGPTGIGFLYGKYDLLNSMPPVFGGGEMIDQVGLYESTYAAPPYRFEAGTPAIAEAVGFGAAIDYLQSIGMDRIHSHDIEMANYMYETLIKVDGITIYGPSPSVPGIQRTGLVSFNIDNIHPTDLSFVLDQEGVAVRTGHHCTQPLHHALGTDGSMRASAYFYNNKADVDEFVQKLQNAVKIFTNMRERT